MIKVLEITASKNGNESVKIVHLVQVIDELQVMMGNKALHHWLPVRANEHTFEVGQILENHEIINHDFGRKMYPAHEPFNNTYKRSMIVSKNITKSQFARAVEAEIAYADKAMLENQEVFPAAQPIN